MEELDGRTKEVLDKRTKEGKLESRLKRLERVALFVEQNFKGDMSRWEAAQAEAQRSEIERRVRRGRRPRK